MMLDTLKKMLAVYGPSGNESAVAEAAKQLLAGKVDAAKSDNLGNLIVEKKGAKNGKTIMISAHMDQIGLVVADVEAEGFLRVGPVGGHNPAALSSRHVVFGNGVHGVLASQPVKDEKPDFRHLFVDIGAKDRADALARVNLGDVCVYAPDFFEVGESRVASPAMDDRCACALLIELLLSVRKPVNTIIGVFSAQEEVGCRGAAVAAYGVDPDLGVALDVTAWGDTPESKLPALKLGEGAAVKFKDSNMIATPKVRDLLIKCAEETKTPYQREVLLYGGTDGGAIQHARAGIPAGTLSIPCRYIHSSCEMIDMRDMDGALTILKALVNHPIDF